VSALLALVTFRSIVSPTVITTLSGLTLLVAFGVALRFRSVSSLEVTGSALKMLSALPWRVLAAKRGAEAQVARTRMRQASYAPLLVPLLLCLVFLPVLSLASPAFAAVLSSAWALLPTFDVPGPLRVCSWVVLLLGGLTLVRPSLMPNPYSDASAPALVFDDQRRLIARNSLGALNALFLGFIALDVAVLVTGHAPVGHTTQSYAHQGAFWLTIALGMLTVVVGVMFRGALAHDPSAVRTRQLAFAWIGQGLVMALCTYGRIAIHVQFSGLSNLRIVGVLGTTLVVVGMLLVGLKLQRRRSFTWLLRRQLDALFLTVVLFAVLPTHYLGARFNVGRVQAGAYAPLIHMGPQSRETEAVLQLLPLLDHRDPAVRRGAADLVLSRAQALQHHSHQAHHLGERDLLTPYVRRALSAAAPRALAVVAESPDRASPSLMTLGYEAHRRAGDFRDADPR
jgi:hypothetical protein